MTTTQARPRGQQLLHANTPTLLETLGVRLRRGASLCISIHGCLLLTINLIASHKCHMKLHNGDS
ncbi:hypothetical protein E2C01_004660 [Portunus trituberculatus]|uniref:Uncharacterized protein n=1 Tax=Portunus trituberculatus TaxID=210409 RepID=A0A5B7CX07_PORTR|nr:hypothetical protein [Portunus trituberculatus]